MFVIDQIRKAVFERGKPAKDPHISSTFDILYGEPGSGFGKQFLKGLTINELIDLRDAAARVADEYCNGMV